MLPPGDIQHLLHELQMHQVELEMQNEELRKVQEEIEESRSRFVDLLDFALAPYFTLDSDGKLFEVNFKGAELLRMDERNSDKSGIHYTLAAGVITYLGRKMAIRNLAGVS
jgi:hypothetical protein